MKKRNSRDLSRREFARGSALAAASAACLSSTLLPAAAGQTPAHEPALSTASQAEVDAKVTAVIREYGNLLSDAEKLDIRRLLTEGQKPLETMRVFPLNNGDQPGNVLRLYPETASKPVLPSQKSGKK